MFRYGTEPVSLFGWRLWSRMKILLVHNSYQQRGGEDEVFANERDLLQSADHEVVEYVRSNDEIHDYSIWNNATLSLRTVWAWDSARDLQELLKREKPLLAHFHNTFPLISPSAYSACQEAGVPVVQTLHNYRLLCPAATFFRDGHACEECLGRFLPWPGIVHACYRKSRGATTVSAAMLTINRFLNTWTDKVNIYVALTQFARQKFIEGGLPGDRILVKPNFVRPNSDVSSGKGDYAVYLGRLSSEKGIFSLLEAWERVGKKVPLRIIGDGPLRSAIITFIERREIKNVMLLGVLAHEEAIEVLKLARFMVFPSQWYETFGMTIAESFACGVPVIASRMGVMEEIVTDGKTGLHFTAGDASDLVIKVDWAWTHPEEMRAMGRAARSEFESKYTAALNYQQLMNIYGRAIAEQQKSGKLVRVGETLAF